jgi:hypothetical protein
MMPPTFACNAFFTSFSLPAGLRAVGMQSGLLTFIVVILFFIDKKSIQKNLGCILFSSNLKDCRVLAVQAALAQPNAIWTAPFSQRRQS